MQCVRRRKKSVMHYRGERERERKRRRCGERENREETSYSVNRKTFFFLVLSDLNQAVPNHLADESQTR